MKLEINRKDWIIERLGDFAISEKGKKPKNQSETETEEFKYPYVDIQGFEKKIFDSYTDGVKCNFCTEDDFLMVWDGSRSGLVGKAVAGAIGSTLVKINLPMIENHFAYYFLKSKYLEINTNAKGTGTPHVNPDLLWNYSFPIVPTLEQKAIVAKIEQLFSELDNAVANLKTAQAKLKIYRQAVLKKAFEKNHPMKKFGNIANIQRGKSKHRPRDDEKLFGGNYPFIQTGEVRAANGKIIRNYSKTYSEFGLSQSKLWKAGTLCLTIAANIADTAFLGFDACFPDSVVGIESDENLDMKFVNYYIQKIKQEIDRDASATAQKNINVAYLEKLEIPYPSIKKQNQIVQEIESRLSVCDKIEETIETSLAKSEALRQSILKKAFEGKLLNEQELENIKNHPEYESAEALIKRIKNERDK